MTPNTKVRYEKSLNIHHRCNGEVLYGIIVPYFCIYSYALIYSMRSILHLLKLLEREVCSNNN